MSANPWRARLPRVYQAFFGRFDALTEIQERALPMLVEGRDVLLCSATASGKTEAYAAPAAEMILASGAGSAAVLIVSPTRALANDLHRRLETRMAEVHVELGRRTGEYKENVGGALPQVVITTPESLDSLIARRPEVLADLRLVVLDEIHVLDGSPRGDQLRILLHRLRGIVRQRPQFVAASATVAEPEALARRYLGSKAAVVQVTGARRIFARNFLGDEAADFARHLDELAGAGVRKILVFCKARRDVEKLANELVGRSRFDDRIFAHHGSLARNHRERVERQFGDAPAGVCFATTTLEMGIDIGTVDYVLLNGPPSDVASLLQRMGRGGRRGDRTRVGCVVGNHVDEFLFDVMLRAGARGELLARPYAFRPGVIVQQALVRAGAEMRTDADDLFPLLPESLQADYPREVLADILERLVEKGRLERALRGSYVLSDETERRYRRGVLHSNIADDLDLDVIDRITGDLIGRVSEQKISRVQLGGGSRRVVVASEGRILTDQVRGGGESSFRSRGSPGISFQLARRVVEQAGVPEWSFLSFVSDGRLVVLHGLGGFGSLLLADRIAARSRQSVVEAVTSYSLRLAVDRLDPVTLTRDEALTFIRHHEKKLTRMAQTGPFQADLPTELRISSLAAMLEVPSLLAFLGDPRLKYRSAAHEDLRDPDLALAL